MDKLIVKGGTKLKGSINISGSKNASLPILAATLLTEETVVIRRVPDVSDTNYMIQILTALGAEVERSSGTVRITAKNISSNAPYEVVSKMRASICVMGNMIITAGDGLKGAEVDLRGKHGPTVLGTDNLMMAAVLAEGTTIIESAACEPEVVDLANFLISLGAKIEGAGTRRITIEGVKKLGGVQHTVIPDRIEAGTFMVAAAMAGTEEGVTLNRVNEEHLEPTSKLLRDGGHTVEFNDAGDSVVVIPSQDPKGCEIVTAPYPGFPTDMQAQFTAMFAFTPGISVVEDTIFPQRFMHCAELTRMGANIKVDNGTAVIKGVSKLSGAPVMASDLRASAALVLAALCAEGESEINRLYHIDRGYENIDDKLAQLGAEVSRIVVEDEEEQ